MTHIYCFNARIAHPVENRHDVSAAQYKRLFNAFNCKRPAHRCTTVDFTPSNLSPDQVTAILSIILTLLSRLC